MPDLITIIEDDESIREMLRYYFHSVGYGVEDFESGEDYFQAVHDVQPDLYILDIMLPGMDGLEILRRSAGRRIRPIFPSSCSPPAPPSWTG